MANSDINVKYVAELARLELPAEQFAAIEKDLSSIVDYIAELNEVDVTGVEPTAHAAAPETADDLEHGRLSAARRAQKGYKFVIVDIKIYIGKNRLSVIYLADIL